MFVHFLTSLRLYLETKGIAWAVVTQKLQVLKKLLVAGKTFILSRLGRTYRKAWSSKSAQLALC